MNKTHWSVSDNWQIGTRTSTVASMMFMARWRRLYDTSSCCKSTRRHFSRTVITLHTNNTQPYNHCSHCPKPINVIYLYISYHGWSSLLTSLMRTLSSAIHGMLAYDMTVRSAWHWSCNEPYICTSTRRTKQPRKWQIKTKSQVDISALPQHQWCS